MIRVINKRLSYIAVCSVICAICLTGSPRFVSAQSGDEPSLRSLVERFFAEYQKEDLKAILLLWSVNSPSLESRRQSFQRIFDTVDKIEIKSLNIGKINLESDKANIRVALETSAVDAKTNKPADDFGKLNRFLHFVKEGADWKIWNYSAIEEELAAALVKTKTDEERKQILDGEAEAVNAELVKHLVTQGIANQTRNNYPQAMNIFKLALNIAEKISDKLSMSLALYRIATVHDIQGNYKQTLECLEASLKFAEEVNDRRSMGAALHYMGGVYRSQGNYAQALSYFDRSLKIKEEVGDKADISSTLENIGLIHNTQGNYKQAQQYLDKSLKFQEEASNPDPASIARTLNIIGAVYRTQGDFTKALEFHQRSLKIAEESGFKPQISQTLNSLGASRHFQGRYAEALAFYQRSLKINYESNDRKAMAYTFRHIGRVYFFQSNYRQALQYQQKSLKISEELGDKVAIADTYNALAVTYGWLGLSKLSLEYSHKSLRLLEELGHQQGVPMLLDNIGLTYREEKNYEKALEYYKRSLKIREASGEKIAIAESLINIGVVYRLQLNHVQALEYHQKSFEIIQKLDHKELIIRGLNDVGYAHFLFGNYKLAAEMSEQAASWSRQIGNLNNLWKINTIKGKAYRALNQPDKARQAFGDAISTVEELRHNAAGGEEGQQRFFEDKISPYHEMVDLLVEQNNAVEAFAYAEQSKGRVLLDAFRNGKIDLTKAMSNEEQEKEKRLKSEIVSLNTQIYREKQRQQPDQIRLSDLDARLQKTRLESEDFETALYATHPELKIQRGQPSLITLKDANALIPDNQTALLEFVVMEDKTHLFVLTRGKDGQEIPELKVYTLNLRQKELTDIVQRFRQRLASHDFSFYDLSSRLHDLLLKQAQVQLKAKTNLVIVPDDVLWELPFQALQPARNHYLIENHAISYAPSLTVLREMTKPRKSPEDGKSGGAMLLAFGNPDVGKETTERAKSVFMDEKLAPLPEAERQVKTLAQLYGENHSKIYTGRDAREETAKSEAGNCRILHLATHGILNDTSPMYSQLLLSQSQENDQEDGLLEAWEIMKLDLKADMVVLSACETARGRFGAGEGMIGMSWALFVAGCPTTVVSQWKVESASTTDLMIEFHKNLKTGITKSESLRNASLKILRSKQYKHPFYWAGFVVIGNGR